MGRCCTGSIVLRADSIRKTKKTEMIREPIRDVVNTNHNLISSIQAVSNGLPEIGVKEGLRIRVDDAFENTVVMAMLAPS